MAEEDQTVDPVQIDDPEAVDQSIQDPVSQIIQLGIDSGLTGSAVAAIDEATSGAITNQGQSFDPAYASSGSPPYIYKPIRNYMEITLSEPTTDNIIHFPFNPSKIQIVTSARTQTFEPMMGAGTIVLPHGSAPYKIQMEGVFPGDARVGDITNPDIMENSPFHDPVGYMNNGGAWGAVVRIDLWQHPEKSNDSQVKLAFNISSPPVAAWVFVESFEYSISGGFGDIAWTMTLSEWRDLLIFTDTEAPKPPLDPTSPLGPTDTDVPSGDNPSTDPNDANTREEEPSPDSYTVVEGDTLYGIARKPSVYGDGGRWTDLYSANSDIIGPNPDLIIPGMVLNVPQ